MKRDPSKVVDATKETRVDWDREVKEGNLTRVTGMVRDTNDPSFQHIQGRPMSDAEAQSRVVPASFMQHVARTGRYPQSSGRSTFAGGWPDFKKEEPTS
jgi:hypothetical protein